MLLEKTVKYWKNGLAINSKKILSLTLIFIMFGLHIKKRIIKLATSIASFF